MHPNEDMLSELLIAQLLEEDMRALTSTQEAERLQMTEVLRDSARASGRIPKKANTLAQTATDFDVALRLAASDARCSSDALFAQTLHADDASAITSRQFAQKLAATEKKILLDAEFARRLQDAVDRGDVDTDDVTMKDAESVLGQDAIEQILASDMNDKGKGKSQSSDRGKDKRRWTSPNPQDMRTKVKETKPFQVCGICMEPSQLTHSPVAAARSANSSARLPFGLRLPCPCAHAYCLSCLGGHIRSKIDPEGDGSGNPDTVVFPIRCPECPVIDWVGGIPDEIAEKVLSEKDMVLWHHQKLLDSMPRHYCPNPRCSALVQMDDDVEEPYASCPSCSVMICVPCRVVWHGGFTCEEYQSLPLDERSPEDQQALQLMKAENWRRCPKCAYIVELTVGCNHIICRCRTEFCFKCGSLWDVRRKRCTREPACSLWDEDMLLEERERDRERERAAQRHRQQGPPPPYAPRADDSDEDDSEGSEDEDEDEVSADSEDNEDSEDSEDNDSKSSDEEDNNGLARGALDWMDDPQILCSRHWFTTGMIRDLKCGYCETPLNSLADLRYHLLHVRWHAVYACCGRFFKREIDFQRHAESVPSRHGAHIHRVYRN